MHSKYFQIDSKGKLLTPKAKPSATVQKIRINHFDKLKSQSEKSSPVNQEFQIKIRSTSNSRQNLNSPCVSSKFSLKPLSKLSPNQKKGFRKGKNLQKSMESVLNHSNFAEVKESKHVSRFSLEEPCKSSRSKLNKFREKLKEFIFNHFSSPLRQLADLRTLLSFYKILHPLGQGAFGKVVLAEQVLTGCKVAIKMIPKAVVCTEEARRKVFREIFILKRISSKFVVKILEYFENNECIYMVLSYMAGGDLLSYLKANGALPEAFAKHLFKQILMGVKSVHSKKILHRDIKLDNILLDPSQTSVQLCDFGISKIIKKHEILNEKCGTPAYLAPEIILECGYQGFWSDCWSLGVVLYCMVCGKVPFKGMNLSELHKSILTGRFELPKQLSDDLKDLLLGLMKNVPFERYSVEQALCHKWLDDCQQFLEENEDGPSGKVIRRMVDIGFPKDYILNSVKNQSLNHAYAVFNVLKSEFS